MTFTWLAQRGREEGSLSDILHVSAQGVHYVVYVSDEAKNELGLPKCKSIAERKIAKDPSTTRILVTTDGW